MKEKITKIELALKEPRTYCKRDDDMNNFVSSPYIPDRYEAWTIGRDCQKIEIVKTGINIYIAEHEIISYPFENILAYKKWIDHD